MTRIWTQAFTILFENEWIEHFLFMESGRKNITKLFRGSELWLFGKLIDITTIIGKRVKKHFNFLFQQSAFPDFSRSRSSIVNSLPLKYTFGGHWLALAYDVHQDRFHFWDPLGFDLTMYPIISNFLLQTRKPVSKYPIKIQSNESISCGFHSLAFLIHLDNKFDTTEYFKLFDHQHLKQNDEISVEVIKAAIRHLWFSLLLVNHEWTTKAQGSTFEGRITNSS